MTVIVSDIKLEFHLNFSSNLDGFHNKFSVFDVIIGDT